MKTPLPQFLAMTSPASVIVGLNGALQKRFILHSQDVLVPGNVHRAKTVQTGVGGKGQDVAIALNCLSSESNIDLAQFVGAGAAGDAVFGLLVDTLGKDAVDLSVQVQSEMRTCTSIIASDETTELVEPSGAIEEEEMKQLLEKLESKVHNGAAGLCVMGSMPPGCPDDTYAQIYSRAAGPETLCVVDSVSGVEPLFRQMAAMENSGSVVFKVNASELCKLAGIQKSTTEAGGVQIEELTDAISQFLAKYSPFAAKALTGLAITDGRHPGHFALVGESEFSLYKLPIPVLESSQTLYPIGAGDAVAAGTLAAWLYLSDQDKNKLFLSPECGTLLGGHFEGVANISETKTKALVSSFAFGLTCGSASCLQEENSVIDVQDIPQLFATTGQFDFLLKQSF